MISENDRIGNYQILRPLANGAFGRVYLARHAVLTNRIVAIKLMHAAYLDSEEKSESFLQEARFLEMLRHPYILPIFDVGIHQGIPYLVTEHAAHGSLRQRLRKQSPFLLPAEESLTILSQIGQALQHAHEQHIIHRDLKPENILFNARGDALLTDFGIATTLATASIKHIDNAGTPAYMAPEQFRGQISKECDQYALGCIAYELFTGRPPFAAPDFFSMGFKHLMEAPVLPTASNPRMPAHIEQAILKALAKQRTERYPTIGAFIEALHTPLPQPQLVPTLPLVEQSATYVPRQFNTSVPELLADSTLPPVQLATAQTTGEQAPLPGGQLTHQPATPVEQLHSPATFQFSDEQLPEVVSEKASSTCDPVTPFPAVSPSDLPPLEKGQLARKRLSRGKGLAIAVTCLVLIAVSFLSFNVFVVPSTKRPVTGTQQARVVTATVGSTATAFSQPTQQVTNPTLPSNAKNTQKTPVPTATPTTPVMTPTPTRVITPTPTPVPVSETLTIYYINGMNSTPTVHSYKGKVTITVSGTGEEAKNKWLDAFYQYTDATGQPITPVHTSTYPGWTLWINGGVADNYVSPIPAYNASHVYTFTINAPGGTLSFGIGDTYLKDNSGSLTITVTQG